MTGVGVYGGYAAKSAITLAAMEVQQPFGWRPSYNT
jgi:hypothetical protein